MFDANHLIFWIGFTVVISIMLWIDLYATDHRQGQIGIKSSLIWSGVWISVALTFNVFIYFFLEDGHTAAIQFFSAYIIEKSLSVDNLFVFIMIFNVMGITEKNQPHILKWGIISAVFMRIIFILAGVALMHLFHPIIYIFGLLLIYAAYKMMFGSEEKIDPEKSKMILFFKRRFNLITNYHGGKFFEKIDGKFFITPLFLTLILIESSDLMFAVDSIPAVLAITEDPFIAITSNIFAILGLRALYFVLAGIIDMFSYLKYGVGIILFYVGVKMIIADWYKISTEYSMLFILAILAASIVVSLIKNKKKVNADNKSK